MSFAGQGKKPSESRVRKDAFKSKPRAVRVAVFNLCKLVGLCGTFERKEIRFLRFEIKRKRKLIQTINVKKKMIMIIIIIIMIMIMIMIIIMIIMIIIIISESVEKSEI